MQPETEFYLYFDLYPSLEYRNQLESFVDEMIDSYTGNFKPPYIHIPGCVNCIRLEKLRRKYERKIEEDYDSGNEADSEMDFEDDSEMETDDDSENDSESA